MPDPARYRTMNACELRESFLLDTLNAPGEIHLAYLDTDRAVVGMASPMESTLALPCPSELRANCFLERRELGALNIGGSGSVRVDGQRFELGNLDCLYLGRGSQSIEFASENSASPAI